MPKYQVSLYLCPGIFPFVFAVHPWLVVEKDGQADRWEIGFIKNGAKISWGYLYKNNLPAFGGITIFPYINKFLWKARLIGITEGDEGSLAQRMSQLIEASKDNYPYRDQYYLKGPNSNTYVQWVLNQFPEFQANLPWNSFGKNYK